MELDPLSPGINAESGYTFYLARRYDQAIVQDRKALEMDPNFVPAHAGLGYTYLKKSMYKEALAEFEKVLVISPGDTGALSDLGYGYAVAGKRAEAQKALERLNELSKRKYVPPVYLARIYSGLGDEDKAFEWLEKGYKEGSLGPTGIKVSPVYDPLRSDPRFADLLRRMNLQP